MDAKIMEMYNDAMILEHLQEVVWQTALCNGVLIENAWNKAKKGLESFVSNLALYDLELAKNVLRVWEESADCKKDFRCLSDNVERMLLPCVRQGLQKKYPYIDLEHGKWQYMRSDSVFFTVRDNETRRYMHSMFDPMWEARCLAHEIYKMNMDSFHILGCGLGYLPYQIWLESEKSICVYIYEDDKDIIDKAFQIGVLSLIDNDHLKLIDDSGDRKMLERFLTDVSVKDAGYYISDNKVGKYSGTSFGQAIDTLDYNQRMGRIYDKYWEINRKSNSKLAYNDIMMLRGKYSPKSSGFAVVSAGPSMNDYMEFLRNSAKEINIISVNTCVRRLAAENIKPDIIVMLDPTPELENHLSGLDDFVRDIPLVMPITGSNAFARKYKGEKYFVTEGNESDGYQWTYGGTVSSLALDIAFYLGGKRIFLIGNDLAYVDGANYATGVAHDVKEGTEALKEGIVVESVDNKMVNTNPLYDMYRKIIERQISAHQDAVVYNMSRHGAVIKGTKPYI